MKVSVLTSSPKLPLVITPSKSSSISTLAQEIDSKLAWIEEQLLHHGAILFRGYSVHTSAEFQAVVNHLIAEVGAYTRGASPRSKVSEKVYTSTDAPKFIPIPLHCELSYTPDPPYRILFFCNTPPSKGGETPIADMRAVYQALDPGVRERLGKKGLRLIQNVPSKKGFGYSKSWQDMFETDDRKEVQDACLNLEVECTWKPDDSLRLVNFRPAFTSHPVTGDQILFTSFYNFHDSWSSEFEIHNLYWLSRFFRIAERFRTLTRVDVLDYPHHCTFSDGSLIPSEDILHVRNILRRHAVAFPWQQGDILLIDNYRVSHGRMPYKGSRRILVSMGSPVASPVH